MADECAMEVSVKYWDKEIFAPFHVTDAAGCIIAHKPIGELGNLLDNAGLNIIRQQVCACMMPQLRIKDNFTSRLL